MSEQSSLFLCVISIRLSFCLIPSNTGCRFSCPIQLTSSFYLQNTPPFPFTAHVFNFSPFLPPHPYLLGPFLVSWSLLWQKYTYVKIGSRDLHMRDTVFTFNFHNFIFFIMANYKEVGGKEPLFTVGGSSSWRSHYANQCRGFAES